MKFNMSTHKQIVILPGAAPAENDVGKMIL